MTVNFSFPCSEAMSVIACFRVQRVTVNSLFFLFEGWIEKQLVSVFRIQDLMSSQQRRSKSSKKDKELASSCDEVGIAVQGRNIEE